MNLFLEKKVRRNKMQNLKRKKRIRFKIKKISERSRLTVFKSNKHIHVQVINDKQGITLASASSLEKIFRESKPNDRKELAEKIGTEIAKRSIKNGVKEVAFDKGKYKYHGIVKIVAEAARAEGLIF